MLSFYDKSWLNMLCCITNIIYSFCDEKTSIEIAQKKSSLSVLSVGSVWYICPGVQVDKFSAMAVLLGTKFTLTYWLGVFLVVL